MDTVIAYVPYLVEYPTRSQSVPLTSSHTGPLQPVCLATAFMFAYIKTHKKMTVTALTVTVTLPCQCKHKKRAVPDINHK